MKRLITIEEPMFLKDGVNIGKWNLNDQIKRAEEIQHELEETCR